MPEFDDSKPAVFDLGGSYSVPEPTFDDSKTASFDLGEGIPAQVGASIVTGLRDVPLAGALFDKALTEAFGVDPELLEEMARTSNSTPWGKGIAFATSMVPEMLIGGAAFSLGRKALVGALRAGVPEAMAALAAPTAQGGRLATSLGRVAARGMDVAGGNPALQALGIVAGSIPKPVLERGAEILGGSLGVGGLYGAAALAEGKDPWEAAKTGAYAAALTGGFETAFTLGAKLAFSGAREVDVGRLLQATEQSPLYKQVAGFQLGSLQQKLSTLQAKLAKQHANPSTKPTTIVRTEQSIKRAETALEVFKFHQDMDPLFRAYLTSTPRNRASAIQTIALKLAKTPEQLAGEMGPATAKVVEMARQAGTATSIAHSITNREMAEIEKLLLAGMGVRKHTADYLLDVVESWQRTGNPITAKVVDSQKLTTAIKAIDDMMEGVNKAAVKIGLAPDPGPRIAGALREWPIILNRQEPARAGFLGKLWRPKGDEELAEGVAQAMVKLGVAASYNQARGQALAIIQGRTRRAAGTFRPGRLGTSTRSVWSTMDEESLASLFPDKTFKEIVEAGAPIVKDPIQAVEAYLNGMARRVSYAQRLGVNGEVIKGPLRELAIAQGASSQLYDNLVDAVTTGSYGSTAEQALAGAVANSQTATRMGLGVFPNAAQGINIPLLTGPQSWVKGLFSRWQQGPIKEAAEASAINDSMIRSWRESYLDPYTRTPYGWAADWVLHHTKFTAVERWNRMWAFHASANYATKTLVKATEGRLRGATLDIARRRFRGIGHNLDDLVLAARQQPGASVAEKVNELLLGSHIINPKTGAPARGMELLSELGMGGVRQTQFLPDKTRLPTFWNTPPGRVAFQFKSFALNQSRLMRDNVINEAAKGNMQPLLYVMASFPLAGELVTTVKQLVKEGEVNRPDSPLARLVEDVTTVGALGLAGDLYRGAVWGPEQVYRAALGPTVEDAAFLINALATADFDRVVERANKLPTYRLALSIGTAGLGLGMAGVPKFTEALEGWLAEDAGLDAEEQGEAPPTLQELQASQRR